MNIVYFVCHDLGRHVGCYDALVESPHIDAFAQEGIRFTNAFCNSAACSPSRNCAMTGQWAHVSGGIGLAHMGWPLSESARTIVDYLNDHGYETIHAGMEHERKAGHNRYATELQVPESQHTHNGVAEALAYLKDRDDSKPFYLNIGSLQPHPCTWNMTHIPYGDPVPDEQANVPPFLPDRPGVRNQFARFQTAIRYMDQHFGELMAGLKAMGRDKDTMVIFTTDHGISFNRAKGNLYDRGLETAYVVRLPDGDKGGTTESCMIQNIDTTPTILDMVGASVPEAINGRSFAPLLRSEAYEPHTDIFMERNFHGEERFPGETPPDMLSYIDRYDPMRCIRTDSFHYIRYFDPKIKGRAWRPYELDHLAPGIEDDGVRIPAPYLPRPKEELFHHTQDGCEFINLADRPEYQGIKAELNAKLTAWMESTNDFVLRDEVPQRYVNPREYNE